MNRKNLTVLLFLLLHLLDINAQDNYNKRLKVGDKVPNVLISDILNYNGKKVSLSGFKGKLVILDFWDKTCSSCIAAFPKMQKIQQEFGNKIQILLITKNSRKELDGLFQRSRIIKETILPFVFGDTILHQYFPHNNVPFHAWIDEMGKVILTTNGYNTTIERVRNYFQNRNIDISSSDFLLDIDDKQYLMTEGNGRQLPHLRSSSVLMNRINDQGSGIVFISDSLRKGVRWINTPALSFVMAAHQFPFSERVLISVQNPNKFRRPTNLNELANWEVANLYCYELVVPKHTTDSMFWQIIKQDIERYFGVRGVKERKKLKCWIVKSVDSSRLKSSFQNENTYERTANGYFFRHMNVITVIRELLNESLENDDDRIVVVDEARYNKYIDIDINGNLYNRSSLLKKLAMYGIQINEEEREFEVLVLREVK